MFRRSRPIPRRIWCVQIPWLPFRSQTSASTESAGFGPLCLARGLRRSHTKHAFSSDNSVGSATGLLPLLARRRLPLETPKSIALAGSQPSVSRRRPEALICIKASALGFDAIGSGHARLPVNHGAGHWTFDESRVASSRRRIFGAWFGEFPEMKSRFSFALKVHLR